ncbi:MAG TPA: type II toxin-antitoxin system VapC family toxin [Stellaceae bacterium]|nr:type II toxin-antitoxin system VapC family toxin [Stellaceae bacterium]
MSAIALDASAAIAWCFKDEASPRSYALLDRVQAEGAVVPGLWHLELGNVLLQAERRGRIGGADAAMRLELIASLPIEVDRETVARALREILALARGEGLTTYDAAYLEVAVRRGVPLATKDAALVRAAKRLGVTTLPF